MKSPNLIEIYARLSVLEGVAGVRPRSWTGRGDSISLLAGMVSARRHLPNVSASWFVTDATPLLTALRKGAADTEDAEDVVMSVIGGLSRPENIEGGELYAVGRLVASSPTMKQVAYCLRRHAAHRSSKEIRRSSRVESVGVLPAYIDMQMKDVGERMDEARIDDAMTDRRWMVEALEAAWASAPGRLAIAKLWVEDPTRSAVEIARIVRPGFQDNTPGSLVQDGGSVYVSRTIRQAQAVLGERAPAALREYVAGGF